MRIKFSFSIMVFFSIAYLCATTYGDDASPKIKGREICPRVVKLGILPFNEVSLDARAGYNRDTVLDKLFNLLRNRYVKFQTVVIAGSCYDGWRGIYKSGCDEELSKKIWQGNKPDLETSYEQIRKMDADIGIAYSFKGNRRSIHFTCYLFDAVEKEVFTYSSYEDIDNSVISYININTITEKAIDVYLNR